MPVPMTMKINDAGGESSTVKLTLPTPTAGTFDAVVTTSANNLRDKILNLTRGTLDGLKVGARDSDGGLAVSPNPDANRELKWLVTYQDDVTGDVHRMEIPCPNVISDLVVPGDPRKNYNPGDTQGYWTAFIGAFEADAVSPAGNAVTFLGARIVGRNI